MAFWRRKDSAAESTRKPRAASPNSGDEVDGSGDSVASVRVRARRRLIGAAALLLAVAVFVPMLLDPAPPSVADNIAIDIPSEKKPFSPRLSLPPVPAPDNVPVAPPPEAAAVPDKVEEAPGKAVDGKAADKRVADKKAADAKAADAKAAEAKAADKRADEQRARAVLEGTTDRKASAAGVKDARFAVQAAAPASEAAARDLAERLKKAGFASYTEKVETQQGARYRVRLGPYASRDEADGVRTRLKSQGIGADLITL